MVIGIIADSFGIMYNMAFSDLRLDSDSKGIVCYVRMYLVYNDLHMYKMFML